MTEEKLGALSDCVKLFKMWRDGIFTVLGVAWTEDPPAISNAKRLLSSEEGKSSADDQDVVSVPRSDLLKLLELAEDSAFTGYNEYSSGPFRSEIQLVERINKSSGRNADLSEAWYTHKTCKVVEDR